MCVFRDSHTDGLVERHKEIVDELTHHLSIGGVKISHLPALGSLLETCTEKLEGENGELYAGCICDMLNTCGSVPFIEETSNQRFRNSEVIGTFFVIVCNLLVADNRMVKNTAAKTVLAIITAKEQRNEDDHRLNLWTHYQHVIQKSGAIHIIAKSVCIESELLLSKDADGDGRIDAAEYKRAYEGEDNMVPLMKLVLELVRFRENALDMIRHQVPVYLVKVVSSLEDFRKLEVYLMVQIIWFSLRHSIDRIENGSSIASTRLELLDKHRDANALHTLGNIETVGMLRSIIERMLVEGFKAQDKMLRNEVLMISTLLSKRQENKIFFLETGFLSLLTLYGSAAELELPTPGNRNLFATSSTSDLQMKELMWYLVKELCIDQEENTSSMTNSLYIQALMTYLKNADRRDGLSHMQNRNLQINALQVLGCLSVHIRTKLIEIDICSTISNFMIVDNQLASHFFLENNVEDVDLINATLHFLTSVVNLPGIQVPPSLVYCLLTFSHVQNPSIRESCFLLLSLICRNSQACRKMFRLQDGISLVSSLLFYNPTDFDSSETLVIAVLSCVQDAIASSSKSRQMFFDYDGTDLLLNLLESVSGNVPIECQIFTVLSDLMTNKMIQAECLSWRSIHSGTSAAGLILNAWIRTSGDSIISDMERPLSKWKSIETPRKVSKLHDAIQQAKALELGTGVDSSVLIADIGARVFSILQAMGFKDIDESVLTFSQRILLELVRHYLLFARGEQWAQMRDELVQEGITPTFYDRRNIEMNIEVSMAKAVEVSGAQLTIKQEQESVEESKDNELFQAILLQRDQKIQAEKVKKQVGLVQRRKEQKERQKQLTTMIE